MKTLLLPLLLLAVTQGFGQLRTASATEIDVKPRAHLSCGSHKLMQYMDRESPGFLAHSNSQLEQIASMAAAHYGSQKKADVLTIPVVFHVLYKDSSQNLADSVLLNQLEILNQAFSHSHPDTAQVRSVFKATVGSADIEFVLASKDPNGRTTTGILRQKTHVDYFGGVLPYKSDELEEQLEWFQNDLFEYLFRITKSQEGGSDEWDPYTYLNIWIGDLSTLEVHQDSLIDAFIIGMATPPRSHPFWPKDSLLVLTTTAAQGIFMHYVAIGNNNPNSFTPPDPHLQQGKVLVHEAGHYLGLRHIWGDSESCENDDYIKDTPPCSSSSNSDCPTSKNSCNNTSQGADLPDMFENYMDYSSGTCATAFTKGQIAVMRNVYFNYRGPSVALSEPHAPPLLSLYPNPNKGVFSLTSLQHLPTQVVVKDLKGSIIYAQQFTDHTTIHLELPAGYYLVEACTAHARQILPMMVE